jgi:Tfp pilus assembly protein FimT
MFSENHSIDKKTITFVYMKFNIGKLKLGGIAVLAVLVLGSFTQWRWSTRLGWQANRLDPRRVLALLQASNVQFDELVILHHPGRPQRSVSFNGNPVPQRDLDVANKSHWWLLARCH